MRAATRAPDHGKLQPWRFTVVEGAARDRVADLFAERFRARHPDATEVDVQRERAKIYRAPTVIVAGMKVALEHKIPVVEQHSAAAAAVENMILAASALGYGTMWKTGDPAYDDAVKVFFGLEATDAILGFVYVGTTEAAPKAPRETRFEDIVRWL